MEVAAQLRLHVPGEIWNTWKTEENGECLQYHSNDFHQIFTKMIAL